MSATTDSYFEDSYFEDPYFEDPYFANLAGSPTIVTRSQTVPITASARSISVWPPNSRRALSVPAPMRELLPPASTKPMRDGPVADIWESISPKPRYTKVTYPECRSRRKMNLSVGRGALLVIMPQKLMDVFMLGSCSHEFAWPRRAASGEYYQVCLVCASAYQYDWKTMRRGDRVDEPLADTTTGRRRSSKKQPTWMPRARRLRSKLPLRYRGKNLSTWYE